MLVVDGMIELVFACSVVSGMLLGVGKCGVDGLGEVVIVDGVVAATDTVAGTMLVTLLLGDVIVVV